MNTNTDIVKPQTTGEILKCDDNVINTLSPIAQGWLLMAAKKVETFVDLERNELAIQSELKDIKTQVSVPNPSNELLKTVQDSIARAKSLYATGKDQRLQFTNIIKEKLIDAAMMFEKRSDVLLAEADKNEFDFRKLVVAENAKGQNKTNELAAFKAHVQNEYSRIATQYRNTLETKITQAYSTALRSQKMNTDELERYLSVVQEFMGKVELDDFIIFKPTYLTRDEMVSAFTEVRAYDSSDDLMSAIRNLNDTFSMYAEDLQNAEAAIKAKEQQTIQAAQQANENLEIETATNMLVSQASDLSITGLPKIKSKVDVVEENSDTWALSVLSAFTKNWQDCRKYLGVKQWSKLSLGQMATALGKLATDQGKVNINPGTVFSGLTLKVIEK